MALLQITTDLSRLVKVLERVAEALERLSPPIPTDLEVSTVEDIKSYIKDEKEEDRDWDPWGPRNDYK